MIVTARQPHDGYFQRHRSILSNLENNQRNSSRYTVFPEFSKLFRNTNVQSKLRNFTPKYILKPKKKIETFPKPNSSAGLNPPAGTKNGSLSCSTTSAAVSARSLPASSAVLSLIEALEMTPKVANTSRGGSNQSTSQSFIDAYLARRKREEIDKLMEMLEGWLDSSPITSHASGPGNVPQAGANGRARSSTSSTPTKLAGQKRSLRRESFDGDDPGGNGNEEDKRRNKRSKVGLSAQVKLACPFFKREPSKYADRQACTGPGYPSISRLKEHIYRAHKQPDNKCNRCCEAFSTGTLLEEHQRKDVPCKVSKDKSIDGITESQYHQLRKKPVGTKTNVERWGEVYKIIFPKATVIPSPYYEYDDIRVPECRSEDLAFSEYIENELIAGVRNDLEDKFNDFAEETRTDFVNIVKSRLEMIQQKFLSQQETPQSLVLPAAERDALSPLLMPDFHDLDNMVLRDCNFGFSDSLLDSLGQDFSVSDSGYHSFDSPKSPSRS